MQKPQMKSGDAKGYGKYIMFPASESRAEEMDEFGDFKITDGIYYDGVIDPRFDPDEVVAWLERPEDNGPDKTVAFNNRPDPRAIARNAPNGTLAILVAVINNNDTDNLLVMLADDLLDRFNATDRIEVAGAPIHGEWGRWHCGLHDEHQGLEFAPGTGKEIPGFRVVSDNRANLPEIRKEIKWAIAWHRSQAHTVEYIGGNDE